MGHVMQQYYDGSAHVHLAIEEILGGGLFYDQLTMTIGSKMFYLR